MKDLILFLYLLIGGFAFIGLFVFWDCLFPTCPDCGERVTKEGDVCQDCAAVRIREAEDAKQSKP